MKRNLWIYVPHTSVLFKIVTGENNVWNRSSDSASRTTGESRGTLIETYVNNTDQARGL